MNIPQSTAFSEFLESIREVDAFVAQGLKQSSKASDQESYNSGLILRQKLQYFTNVVNICLLECEHSGELLNKNSVLSPISFKIRKQPKSVFEAQKSIAKMDNFIEWLSFALCFADLHHSNYVMWCWHSELMRYFKEYSMLFIDV